MKFLFIVFGLIFIFQTFAEGQTSGSDTMLKKETLESEEESKESKEKTVEPGEESEEEVLMRFLMEEVIPAFGGFQDLFFSNKPSFDIHWTPQGMQVRNCSFKFQLKQLRAVQYNLADIKLYGFHSNAEIGDPGFLFVQMSCGEAGYVENKIHFNIKFFVTDEELTPAYYSLKIKTMDKEQLDIKLKSIDMDVDIETADFTLILDQYGHTKILPHESPFLKFFDEEKAYMEIVEDDGEDESNGDDKDNEEDEQIKNMYDIPISIWNQINEVDKVSSDENSLVPLKKVAVEQTIHLKGSVEMFLPIYKGGVKEYNRVVVPIVGRIFSPVKGEVIPIIDISTRK